MVFLDPAKVTRSALQNATSVASTLLTTESVVANIKEDAPAMPAGGAGGMGNDVIPNNKQNRRISWNNHTQRRMQK